MNGGLVLCDQKEKAAYCERADVLVFEIQPEGTVGLALAHHAAGISTDRQRHMYLAARRWYDGTQNCTLSEETMTASPFLHVSSSVN